MDSRIPLPNSLWCPALALFRKYNYPDKAFVEAFKDEELKKHLNLISHASVELKNDGTIEQYGTAIEPEHIIRRTRGSNHSSSGSICGRSEARTEQEGKDTEACTATPSGGVGGSEGNQSDSIVSEGTGTGQNNSASRAIPKSTE